eukprot:scaffold2951_cov192-Amphora_coffeaeformis.AAC.2
MEPGSNYDSRKANNNIFPIFPLVGHVPSRIPSIRAVRLKEVRRVDDKVAPRTKKARSPGAMLGHQFHDMP